MTEKDWNPQQIFVFGSNLAGKHGAGAAKFAMDKCGAVWGISHGHVGNSFGIPTKDEWIQTLPLYRIQRFVINFLEYAKEHPELTFQLTPIGCGLAGYTPKDIAPFFNNAPKNVILPQEFKEVIVEELNAILELVKDIKQDLAEKLI